MHAGNTVRLKRLIIFVVQLRTKPFANLKMKKVLTINEAVELTGYKKSYIYRLTSDGIIPHSKPNGRKVFFDREKLEDWLLSNPKSSHAEKQSHAATYVNHHQ